jgi:hypothetical protein
MNHLLAATPNSTAEQCDCGHSAAGHDHIAVRYCRATAANVLVRGCICTDQSDAGHSEPRKPVPTASGD